MSPAITPVVVVLKTLTLILGGAITLFSYRAYRRTGSPALRALTFGFAVITIGVLLAGIVDQIVSVAPGIALAIESFFMTAGFAILLYSLYVE
jgi:divalent metal cation (Fe/Co/Zn/Cd) transporter